MLDLENARGFDRDAADLPELQARGFSGFDIERAFLNGRGTVFPDLGHSREEERYWLIGITDDGRHVTVPFTMRDDLIRPITAWTTNRKYRRWVR